MVKQCKVCKCKNLSLLMIKDIKNNNKEILCMSCGSDTEIEEVEDTFETLGKIINPSMSDLMLQAIAAGESNLPPGYKEED
jgi:hypothetical protein